MASRKKAPVSKEHLMRCIQNTYDDASFLVGSASSEDGNFFEGLCRHGNHFWDKQQLLTAVSESRLASFPCLPDFEEDLIINRHLYVTRHSINRAQVFPRATDVDGFVHHFAKSIPWYDIYFKFNHADKTVTFALGSHRRIMPLVESSGWAWKLMRSKLLCVSSEHLEKAFLDELWNDIAVRIGRKALRIRDVV